MPVIPQKAFDSLERDEEWRSKWKAPRDDIQSARRGRSTPELFELIHRIDPAGASFQIAKRSVVRHHPSWESMLAAIAVFNAPDHTCSQPNCGRLAIVKRFDRIAAADDAAFLDPAIEA
jgi:hypothetical protein